VRLCAWFLRDFVVHYGVTCAAAVVYDSRGNELKMRRVHARVCVCVSGGPLLPRVTWYAWSAGTHADAIDNLINTACNQQKAWRVSQREEVVAGNVKSIACLIMTTRGK